MAVSPERFAPRNNELALTRNFALNNFMTEKVKEYRILSEDCSYTLELVVKEYLSTDWRLQGGPFTNGDGWYYQAVVR